MHVSKYGDDAAATAEIQTIMNRTAPQGPPVPEKRSQRMAENKARYLSARAAITAKGSYTVLEENELESLSSNSGDGADYRRFKQALDDYLYRRELPGQTTDFPPFEYIPESAAG